MNKTRWTFYYFMWLWIYCSISLKDPPDCAGKSMAWGGACLQWWWASPSSDASPPDSDVRSPEPKTPLLRDPLNAHRLAAGMSHLHRGRSFVQSVGHLRIWLPGYCTARITMLTLVLEALCIAFPGQPSFQKASFTLCSLMSRTKLRSMIVRSLRG